MLDILRNLEPNYIFMLGVLIGIGVGKLFRSVKSVGVLRIDRTNPEKDLYTIEIENLECLNDVSEVLLKVDNNANLSNDTQK